MGCPLGPLLANLFMGYHERNWLQQIDIGEAWPTKYKCIQQAMCEVLLYRRYVDDIFCMFKNEIDAEF